jgi:hypothetical protein
MSSEDPVGPRTLLGPSLLLGLSCSSTSSCRFALPNWPCEMANNAVHVWVTSSTVRCPEVYRATSSQARRPHVVSTGVDSRGLDYCEVGVIMFEILRGSRQGETPAWSLRANYSCNVLILSVHRRRSVLLFLSLDSPPSQLQPSNPNHHSCRLPCPHVSVQTSLPAPARHPSSPPPSAAS